jgi:gliding motility-associated-like protein
MKIFIKILFLFLSFNLTYAQSPSCATASAMCTGQGGPYNNTYPGTVGGNQTGYGPITGCGGSGSLGNNGSLVSTPRPAWFYYTIGQTGPIILNLQQFSAAGVGIDVDFALWGPFQNNNLANICNNLSGIDIDGIPSNNYTGPCNLVDASYDPTYNETIHIPNAQVGEVYMLLVTNYSTNPTQGTYTINQTNAAAPGAGQVSCDVVCGVTLGADRIFCTTNVQPLELIANWIQAPTTTGGTSSYKWYFYNGTDWVLRSTTSTDRYTVNETGFWRVSVQRPGCTQVAQDDIEVRFTTRPSVNNPSDLNAPVGLCSHTFDLTQMNAALTNPVPPSNYVIKFYLDENDCLAGNTNFITNPASYTVTTTTTIYVRVENSVYSSCADSSKFFDLVIQCNSLSCQLDLTSAVATSNQTICFNSAIQDITYSFGGEATSATVTGLPTGLLPNINAGVLTISGTPTQTGVFNYEVTTVGCTTNIIKQGTITINPLPSVTGLTSNTSLCAGSDAVFTINGTAGSVVTYTINNGSNQTVTIPTSGQATVTVTAPTSNVVIALSNVSLTTCNVTLTNSATVEVKIVPDVTSITTTTPICSGSNAVFTINGTPNATITYALNNGTAATTVLNSSGIGTITVSNAQVNQRIDVTLIALNGCSRVETLTETIVVNTTPVVSNLTSNTPICAGSNAIFTITGTAGSVVTYTINNGSNQTVTIPTSGQATVTITAPSSNVVIALSNVSLNSCSTTLSNTTTVDVRPVPSVTSLTSNTSICSGSNAVFTINGSANATVTYSVNNGTSITTTLNGSGIGTITLSNSTANVSVTLSQINNGACSTSLTNTANVTVLALPNVTALTSNSPICSGSNAIFTITGTANATVSYSLNGATSTNVTLNATGTSVIPITNATANQSIQLTNVFDGTCNRSLTNSASVVVNPMPNTPTITPQSDTFCIGEEMIFNVSGGANEIVSYTVNNGANQTLNLNASGTGIISITNPTTVIVEINLVNITNGLCSKLLTLSSDADVVSCDIPKGVSPNGDGLNDTWDLTGYNVKKVEIFNRYGTKVYSKSNYVNEWHGQSDNSNELPDGTYYYVVEFNDSPVKTGWVYINREQ